ncbi:MAG: hypothetical protein EB015_12035 [Methylocystaceae bacterium]|nr:hypothetical protein [Methylocystaceae bacterium]
MRAALVFIVLIASISKVEAHAFAQRYDLPLPLFYYIVGAGATVLVSVLIITIFAQRNLCWAPTLQIPISYGVAQWIEGGLRLIGIVSFMIFLASGFLGEQGDWDSNFLPVSVWVLWWVGLAFLASLLVDFWPLLDPWRSLGLWLFRAAPSREYKWLVRLDTWPAVALLLSFFWAELVWTENAVPHKLATLIMAGSLVTFAGMALMGVETWRRHFDAFGLFFSLFGRFAPIAVRRDNSKVLLLLRPYGAGLKQDQPPSVSFMAFVILLLGSVTFDGINETPFWENITGIMVGIFYELGFIRAFGYGIAGALIKTLGLLATPLVFILIFLAVCALTGRLSGQGALLIAQRHVMSLTPIAIAYHLAHYLSYLLIQGQAALPFLTDPLNLGWDLFGWAGREVDIAVVNARFIWVSALTAIIIGHIAAVFLAHQEALRDTSGWDAVRRQWPMTTLMVAYTMLSLWILSQPIVEV